eukprot:350508-Chlamydomonas_euryale.AAC.3
MLVNACAFAWPLVCRCWQAAHTARLSCCRTLGQPPHRLRQCHRRRPQAPAQARALQQRAPCASFGQSRPRSRLPHSSLRERPRSAMAGAARAWPPQPHRQCRGATVCVRCACAAPHRRKAAAAAVALAGQPTQRLHRHVCRAACACGARCRQYTAAAAPATPLSRHLTRRRPRRHHPRRAASARALIASPWTPAAAVVRCPLSAAAMQTRRCGGSAWTPQRCRDILVASAARRRLRPTVTPQLPPDTVSECASGSCQQTPLVAAAAAAALRRLRQAATPPAAAISSAFHLRARTLVRGAQRPPPRASPWRPRCRRRRLWRRPRHAHAALSPAAPSGRQSSWSPRSACPGWVPARLLPPPPQQPCASAAAAPAPADDTPPPPPGVPPFSSRGGSRRHNTCATHWARHTTCWSLRLHTPGSLAAGAAAAPASAAPPAAAAAAAAAADAPAAAARSAAALPAACATRLPVRGLPSGTPGSPALPCRKQRTRAAVHPVAAPVPTMPSWPWKTRPAPGTAARSPHLHSPDLGSPHSGSPHPSSPHTGLPHERGGPGRTAEAAARPQASRGWTAWWARSPASARRGSLSPSMRRPPQRRQGAGWARLCRHLPARALGCRPLAGCRLRAPAGPRPDEGRRPSPPLSELPPLPPPRWPARRRPATCGMRGGGARRPWAPPQRRARRRQALVPRCAPRSAAPCSRGAPPLRRRGLPGLAVAHWDTQPRPQTEPLEPRHTQPEPRHMQPVPWPAQPEPQQAALRPRGLRGRPAALVHRLRVHNPAPAPALLLRLCPPASRQAGHPTAFPLMYWPRAHVPGGPTGTTPAARRCVHTGS